MHVEEEGVGLKIKAAPTCKHPTGEVLPPGGKFQLIFAEGNYKNFPFRTSIIGRKPVRAQFKITRFIPETHQTLLIQQCPLLLFFFFFFFNCLKRILVFMHHIHSCGCDTKMKPVQRKWSEVFSLLSRFLSGPRWTAPEQLVSYSTLAQSSVQRWGGWGQFSVVAITTL